MKMLQQVFVHTVAIVKDRFWQSRQERMMGDFFNGDNMNTYALFVMGHFGTKHLYPLTKIRNCNCIYNFWRPSHMRGGFLFPDIRVERSSSLRSQMLRQRHSFSLACFFLLQKYSPHIILWLMGFIKASRRYLSKLYGAMNFITAEMTQIRQISAAVHNTVAALL